MFTPAAVAVAGNAGVAVTIAVGNPGVIVGAMKDVVTVKDEATPMTLPLITRVP